MQSTMLAHRTIVNRNTHEYGTASNEADLSRGDFEAPPPMTGILPRLTASMHRWPLK
jgi:hypothetical protein